MDVLQVELAKLRKDANLTQSIEDVDKIIEQLERARESIFTGMRSSKGSCRSFLELQLFELSVLRCCELFGLPPFANNVSSSVDPKSASITLAKLQNPLKTGFDKVNDDLKKVHRGHSSYGKVLDKVSSLRDCIAGQN